MPNVHDDNDTDGAPHASHHTLGVGPNQAFSGERGHALEVASTNEHWEGTSNNLFQNPSFTEWDGSIGDLDHYPNGSCKDWGTFWASGIRGIISKEIDPTARDGVCIKWTPADPAGSLQHIFSEAIFLHSSEATHPMEISCWLRVENSSYPVTFSGAIYQAAHPNPAPFDGGTTATLTFPNTVINHTDWRKYTFIFDLQTSIGIKVGFNYQAFFFSFTVVNELPRLYMDQVGLTVDILSTYQIPPLLAGTVDYPEVQIPIGWNRTDVGESRGWKFIDGPPPPNSFAQRAFLKDRAGKPKPWSGLNYPGWAFLNTADMIHNNASTSTQVLLSDLLDDTGWVNVTFNTGWAGTLQVRRIGKVCYLRGTSTRAAAGSTTVCTLATNFRPTTLSINSMIRISSSVITAALNTAGSLVVGAAYTTGDVAIWDTWNWVID